MADTTNTTAALAATQPKALRLAEILDNFYTGIGRIDATAAAAELRRLHALAAAPAAQEAEPAPIDDIAVDRFAAAMKDKLAAARAKGRGGWETAECTQERLSTMLREHVEKGDPRDVANFCMFLWARGEAIAAVPQAPAAAVLPAEVDLPDAVALLREMREWYGVHGKLHYLPLLEKVDALLAAPQAPAAAVAQAVVPVAREYPCSACCGTGADGDVGQDGRVTDVACNGCGGSGKTSARVELPWPWKTETEVLHEAINHIQGQERLKNALRIIAAAAVAPAEDDDEEVWRRLALQFDGHRMRAIGLLKLIDHTLKGGPAFATEKIQGDIARFLSEPPLSGEEVLAERIARAAAPTQEAAPLTQAALDVLAERLRQVEAEGWTPEHDDQYPPGTMARAAACYATINTYPTPTMWPWAPEWWKPRDDRSNYVRAAALLIAELERLDRAAARARQEGALHER